MEVKTAAWSTVALVIAAFGAVVIYSIEREGIKGELSQTQKEFDGQESVLATQIKTLASRKADYEALQGRVAAITAIGKRMEAQESKNGETTKRVEELRAAWASERKAFARDIDSVRAHAKDDVMPELKLVDGKTLKSVHFKEIKDSLVILEHSDGIARVPLANMSPDWMGRLALGWNPRLSAELSGQPDAPEPVAEAAAPVPTVAEVRQAHVESVKRADVTEMESKIRALTRQIANATAAIRRFEDVASEYEQKYMNALSKGNMSNHKVKRDQALSSAKSLREQIIAAQSQINRLMEEIRQKSGQ
ncbi:MAG: hypothetical protein V4726_11380 [Verrucomicrobiota bacterium]